MPNPNPRTDHLDAVRGKRKSLGTSDTKVRLSPEQKHSLERIAEQYGCLYDRKPSLSELLKRIAEGQLLVMPSPPPVPKVSKADG